MTMGLVAAPPAPTTQAQPVAPVADKVTHAPSPFIPPMRTKAVEPAQEPDVKEIVEPAADAPPAEAKEAKPAAEPELDEEGNELIDYDEGDEFDVTINGKTSSVTLGKLIASYQRGEAANAKFNEAKEMRERAIGLARAMTTPEGFVQAMQSMKVDPYRIAEDLLLARAEEEEMTPDQRRMRQLERENADYQRRVKQEHERQQQAQAQQQSQQAQARLLDAMGGALDRLQVTDPELRSEIVSRAAGILRADYEANVETTPQQAIQEAWDAYRTRLMSHAKALPVDQRVSEEERARLTSEAAAKRVAVAQAAPRTQQPRDDDGKFKAQAPKKPARIDMWSPVPAGGNKR